MAGAGVGGGSLNYANTLYRPPSAFFRDPQWARHHRLGGRARARTTSRRAGCSGVTTNPTTTPADEVMREVAEQMGVGDTFTSTPVGVFYGEPGVTVPDPYFGGVGPERTGCTECGSCMTGLPRRRQEHAR